LWQEKNRAVCIGIVDLPQFLLLQVSDGLDTADTSKAIFRRLVQNLEQSHHQRSFRVNNNLRYLRPQARVGTKADLTKKAFKPSSAYRLNIRDEFESKTPDMKAKLEEVIAAADVESVRSDLDSLLESEDPLNHPKFNDVAQ